MRLWMLVAINTGFRETLRADIDVGRFQQPEARSKNMNLVIVSHGLSLRVFLMHWYKWTVQQFEGLYNFGNTEMLVMELGPGGRSASAQIFQFYKYIYCVFLLCDESYPNCSHRNLMHCVGLWFCYSQSRLHLFLMYKLTGHVESPLLGVTGS